MKKSNTLLKVFLIAITLFEFSLSNENIDLMRQRLKMLEADYNSALSDLEVHLNNSAVELSRPDMKIKTMKLENEANLKYELYVAQRLAFEKAENLEKDNTETLLVIQSATQPIKQSWPKNLLIIALSFISSLFGAIYLLVLKRKFE